MLIRNSEFTDADPDGQLIADPQQGWRSRLGKGLSQVLAQLWRSASHLLLMWDQYQSPDTAAVYVTCTPDSSWQGGRKLQKFVAVSPIWRLKHKPYRKNLATLRGKKVMLKVEKQQKHAKKRNKISGSVNSWVLYLELDINIIMNSDYELYLLA